MNIYNINMYTYKYTCICIYIYINYIYIYIYCLPSSMPKTKGGPASRGESSIDVLKCSQASSSTVHAYYIYIICMNT